MMTKPNLTFAMTVLLAGTLGSHALIAQAADSAPSASTTTAESKTAKPPTSSEAPTPKESELAKDKVGAKSKDKGFIPSEEISEDFAVSFPVDI